MTKSKLKNKSLVLSALFFSVALSSGIFATADTIRVIRSGLATKTSSPIVTDMTVEGTLTYGVFSTSGDFGISKATPLMSVTSSTDTAATLKIDAGASSDGAVKFYDSAVARWAAGLDSSDSDSFVISSGATLGTTNALKLTTAGVTVPNTLSVNGNADVTKATPVLEVAANTDTAATIKIDGGATTDAALKLESNNVAKWALGTDVSASEAFVISSGGTLGTSNALSIASTLDSTFSGAVKEKSVTLAADANTFNANLGNQFVTIANNGATAITAITNGTAGQVVTIIGGSSSNATTIADSGIFALTAAFTANANDTLTIRCVDGSNWVEIGRADN